MDLINCLENNCFGVPDSKIDTLLSTLYFFNEKVIKIYKHKKAFYGDLSDSDFRRDFYIEDFTWNNTLSPDLYLRLVGVVIENNIPVEVSHGSATDFYIEMKKIDSSKNITNLLDKNKITSEDLESITSYMIKKIRVLTSEKKEKMKDLFLGNWKAILTQDVEDLRGWMYMADTYIFKGDVDEIIDFLKTSINNDEYISSFKSIDLAVSIDNQGDNILMIDNKPLFIDIMPPKYNWRVCDEFFNISRIAVDAYVLGDEKKYESVYEVFNNFGIEPPERTRIIYEIRSALILWPYRHILGQNEMAEKYKKFTLDKINILKSL